MTDTSPEAVEWPNEIWAEDREDSYCGLYRISVYATVNERREYARYVHHGVHESLQKYHDAMVANLRAEIASLSAALTESRAETAAAYDRAAQLLDIEAADLKSDADRFRSGTDPHHYRMNFASAAIRQAKAIRALNPAARGQMIAEAEARGMQRAAEITNLVARQACITSDEMRGAAMVECAILAMIGEKK